MMIENTAPDAIQGMLDPLGDGEFCFECHPGVPCFTECCRDLNLMLTPYDIVRLKNRLKLEAGVFLERYCSRSFDEQRNLPMLALKMRDDAGRTCPFVSPDGCALYEDRPAACRIYPLARASRVHPVHGTVQEDYFVLHEKHCLGFEEKRDWSSHEWIQDQGLELYHELNDLWMAIITHPRLRQPPPLGAKQQQMFFLASYNVDRFREFVLQSRFLRLFNLPAHEEEAVRESDEALLRLSFRWLNFSLLNQPALSLRENAEDR